MKISRNQLRRLINEAIRDIDYIAPDLGGASGQYKDSDENPFEIEMAKDLAQWAMNYVKFNRYSGEDLEDQFLHFDPLAGAIAIVKEFLRVRGSMNRFAVYYPDLKDDEWLRTIGGKMTSKAVNPAYIFRIFEEELKEAMGRKINENKRRRLR
jgi:hypothetical protein